MKKVFLLNCVGMSISLSLQNEIIFQQVIANFNYVESLQNPHDDPLLLAGYGPYLL